jgi:ATP-dependent helicase/nuclease subunit A
MTIENLLEELDEDQKKAASLKNNGVTAAGAGSGKTRVLASRYAWLIAKKNLSPSEIVTLTFTNKAVSEMYSRIYQFLLKLDEEENAKAAVKNFHTARISTLDSFSASISRTAARRYGINPEFSSDDAGIRALALESSLRFTLDNRKNYALRQLLAENKIKRIAEEIFTRAILNYSPVSSPLDLDNMLLLQKNEILKQWKKHTADLSGWSSQIVNALKNIGIPKKDTQFRAKLEEAFVRNKAPIPPDIEPLFKNNGARKEEKAQILKFLEFYSNVRSIRKMGKSSPLYAELVELFNTFKDNDVFSDIESIARYGFQFEIITNLFALLKKFQDLFNSKRCESGLLTFNDIAHLAVDALKDHPDIRKAYKDSIKMILVDEFQDNNSLQRDLIYLLAENSKREETGIPKAAELENNRMFFVGDEKQSIYRFRGADIAVFNSLGEDLLKTGGGKEVNISLGYNYRSHKALIDAFNMIFGSIPENGEDDAGKDGGVFPKFQKGLPAHEAVYRRIRPPKGKNALSKNNSGPLAHFCFLDKSFLPDDDSEGLRSQDMEAVFIAQKIIELKEKENLRDSDFAILMRSYTHQGALEKALRTFNIIYSADRPAGLFSDAPINDLRSYLRLLVYPEDRIAYASLIRSPFMRLSDITLTVCMLSGETEPFSEKIENLIPNEELGLYRRAREHFNNMLKTKKESPVTELLLKLWYDEGYRYETIWSRPAQVYEELFDIFFELARNIDEKGKSLAEFLDYLEDVISREEKPDGIAIPGESGAGVRLLTIHKSKGLEFPVVFIFDSSNSNNTSRNSSLLDFHEKWGFIFSLPQSGYTLNEGDNYFRRILKNEEKEKDTAELKRLLYVAMTRAENRLFLTFSLPKQTAAEKEAWNILDEAYNKDAVIKRLVQYTEKESETSDFLKLLAPILPRCPGSLCAIETIPVLSKGEIFRLAGSPKTKKLNQKESALAAGAFYENAAVLESGKAGPENLSASRLKLSAAPIAENRHEEPPLANGLLDNLLEKAKLEPADFGSLVHAILEGKLKNRAPKIPAYIKSRFDDGKVFEKVKTEAEAMADKFLKSELGRRMAESKRYEAEYPIVTAANAAGKKIPITGTIDLLFEEELDLVVVDFKTDRNEKPGEHYPQLKVYAKAAQDIFGKNAEAWIFYLRSGNAENVTDRISELSIDALAEAALGQSGALLKQ